MGQLSAAWKTGAGGGIFDNLLCEDMCIHTDPEEAILAEDEPYILPQLGFWLPNGVQIKDFVGSWMNRYNELKSVHEVTAGNNWPGDPGVENAMARLLAIESGQLQNWFMFLDGLQSQFHSNLDRSKWRMFPLSDIQRPSMCVPELPHL